MNRYVAMLRGINLGAKNRIAMPALKAAFEETGYTDVETYVQSGNVIFAAPEADDHTLAASVHQLIEKRLDLSIPVIVRSAKEMQRVVSENPFLKESGVDQTKLHVTFLAAEPEKGRVEAIKSPDDGRGDDFRLLGRDLFLHYPIDYGHSKMTNAYFEKKLGVTATTRNWKSVMALAELANN